MNLFTLLLLQLLYVADKKQVIHVYDDAHREVRTLHPGHTAKPRGIASDGKTLVLSSGGEVIGLDLATDTVRWRTPVDGSPADRLDLCGDEVLVPSGFNSQNSCLFVLSLSDGKLKRKVTEDVPAKAHNCLVLGQKVLLAGIGSHWMGEYDPAMHLVRRFDFSDNVRPYVVDSGMRHLFVNLDNLLGFEVLDLASGGVRRIEAPAVPAKHPPHHQCPSHGLGLTPDGKELWVVDSAGDRLLIFDGQTYALKQALECGPDPGWINFSRDGRYAYPSTGEVIEVATRRTVARICPSEKVLEIQDGWVGKQYGLGLPLAP